MKRLMSLVLLCLPIFIFAQGPTQKVVVKVTEMRSQRGILRLAIFRNKDEFDQEKPARTVLIDKRKQKNGELVATIELEPGEYGLSILDDENNNREMDYNWIGIPKEGFGFSDYFHTGIFKPSFDNFKFRLGIFNKPKTVTVKMKYM